MGSWGTGIFSNDSAADIRSDYRDLLGSGMPAEEASAKILKEYCLGDPRDADNNDVWLGLAAVQHQTGHIAQHVIDAALAITGSPKEIERWEPEDRKQRKKALDKLAQTLRQPPLPPRVIRPRRLAQTALEPGQFVLYTDPATRSKLLLQVLTIREEKSGRYPVLLVLDWNGDPDGIQRPQDLRPLAAKPASVPGFSNMGSPYLNVVIVQGRLRKGELQILATRADPPTGDDFRRGLSFLTWSEMPAYVRGSAVIPPPTIRL
jgi:hypothetical protein